MGIDIAKEVVAQNYQSADQRLWRHVLLNAFEDARLEQSDRKSSIYKMEAHEWIAADSKDFQTICWWSGWDPEEVRGRYMKAVKSGDVTFNDRQVKWIKYYKKYFDEHPEWFGPAYKEKQVEQQMICTVNLLHVVAPQLARLH